MKRERFTFLIPQFCLSLFLLSLIALFYSCGKTADVASPPKFTVEEGLSANEYIALGIQYFNESKYEEAVAAANHALQLKPDTAIGYAILSAVYDIQQDYRKAAEAGEKAFALDPAFYENLAVAYNGLGDPRSAKTIYEKALATNTNDSGAAEGLKSAEAQIKSQDVSLVISVILILILAILLFLHYRSQEEKSRQPILLMVLLLSGSVSCVLYLIFFQLAAVIHSTNTYVSPAEVTPMVRRFIFEHDGVEGYSLYLMAVLCTCGVTINAYFLFRSTKKSVAQFAGILLLAFSAFYIFRIGFFPPVATLPVQPGASLLLLLLITAGIVALLDFVARKHYNWLWWIVPVILLPVCFISTGPISIPDYAFVLNPALRLVHGFKPSEIYFQYDIFLSLLASLWLKLNLNPLHLQVLGQLSFFLFFIAAFWLAGKLFFEKRVAACFIIALVIVRYYAVMDEPTALFQITPWRLDLWILLLLAVYLKGPYHWTAGLLIGMLLLLHKNFGLIYFGSYLLFIFFLALLELPPEKNRQLYITWMKKQALLIARNFVIIVAFAAISFFVFKGFVTESAVLYQQLGIGMIQISKISFYWYVLVLFGVTAALLITQRKFLTFQYFSTGLFLLLLAIGNPMYFFGRSHENNLLNISGAILLTFFFAVDLANHLLRKTDPEKGAPLPKKKSAAKKITPVTDSNERVRKILVPGIPVLFILLVTIFYADRISGKVVIQSDNLSKSRFIYTPEGIPTNFTAVRELTHNSDSIFFLNYNDDFYFYYYGHYVPQGYYNPVSAWPFKKDLAAFLQDLLDHSYYIVTTNLPDLSEMLPLLSYNSMSEKDGFTVISKIKNAAVLPMDSTSLLHSVLGSEIPASGMTFPTVLPEKPFTLELLLMPHAEQVNYATVISEISPTLASRGFLLQQNVNQNNTYVFATGDGKKWSPSGLFPLVPDTWNYLAIVVSKDSLKVYNNGKLLSSAPHDSQIKDPGTPLTIGNLAGQPLHFNGTIKEIKIINGETSAAVISETAQNIMIAIDKEK